MAFNSHKILIKNDDVLLTGFCYQVQHLGPAPEDLSAGCLIHSLNPREPHASHYLQASLNKSSYNNGSLTYQVSAEGEPEILPTAHCLSL